MSNTTERWSFPDSFAPSPAHSEHDDLPLTLVSDRTPVRHPDHAPVAFPGYEILDELGRGGMGVVYRARQQNLNRLVALKVILGGPLASSEDKARFRVEAEAAARLQHPNIVQVYDVGEHAGFSYMALELIEGPTLRQWQHGKPLNPKLAARLVSTLARALHHAHELGIVHRDVKPANILLAPVAPASTGITPVSAAVPASGASQPLHTTSAPLNMTLKVTDFGLAKPLEGGSDLTMTGVACGTPNYMAPEQVRGKALSPSVDVYGLGAVLYELLAGQPPFVGTDAAEVMNLIMKSEPPAVRRVAPAVPRDLAVIVAKCLEKSPERRYHTARDLADDLDRFLGGKPITARPVGTTERAWRWMKRNPAIAAFLCISTFGCLVTGGMAVAWARTAADERAERAAAVNARVDADRLRREAETARDELKNALAAAQSAKTAADRAREAAKQDARLAKEKEKEADTARDRAEANLRVARGVIRVSLRELSRHPRFEDDDFRAARNTLIEQVRTFRDTVARQAPNTPEWLDDLADVSHWLGFLEYLNDNQNEAAAEYCRAADAAGRWVKLEPNNPDARGRQADSLRNAGNALYNARRFAEAETCYRDAVKLAADVVAAAPTNAVYRRHLVECFGQLANVLRATNQFAEAEKIARIGLEEARELVHLNGETVPNLRSLAAVQASLGNSQVRNQKWDEADCSYSEAVATRDRVRTVGQNAPSYSFEFAAMLLSHARFLHARGQFDRASDLFQNAVSTLEKAYAAAPNVNAHAADLATGCAQYAEFLRQRGLLAAAEPRYDQAIALMTVLLRRTPTFRPARAVLAVAMIGRAHLYNQTKRHREAAAEWSKLAKEDLNKSLRTRHTLFVMQSLLFADDWRAARAIADLETRHSQPGWMWLDMGRVWCLVIREVENDATLTPAERLQEIENAMRKALHCLEQAKLAGEFARNENVNWYNSNRDFTPVRGKFDPLKK